MKTRTTNSTDISSPRASAAEAAPEGGTSFWRAAPFALAAGLIGLHLYFGLRFIHSAAATYDEPVHLASGYSYWMTGRYRLNIMDHPPLAEMWDAVPLLWLKPNLYAQLPDWIEGRLYHYSDYFLYHNRIDADRMLNAARLFSLFTWTALLAFGTLAWARRLAGDAGMAGAALSYAFCPAILSNLSLVTTDAASTVFFFLTFYLLSVKTASSPSSSLSVPARPAGGRQAGPARIRDLSLLCWTLAGVCMGLALASKFNMILIGPLALGLAILEWRLRPKPRPVFPVLGFALFLGSGLLALAAVYRFGQFPLYWQGLSATLHRLDEGRSSFFLGRHSTTGSLFYFPVALAVKMPVATLILSGIGAARLIRSSFPQSVGAPDNILRGQLSSETSSEDSCPRRCFWGAFAGVTTRKSVAAANEVLWLVVPPLAYFAAAMTAKVQIGLRHVLPVIPFMIVWAGCGAAWLWEKRWGKIAAAVLSVWLAGSVWNVQPHDLTYFNEFTGGPSRGYMYLTDSNVDWGQGLKDLAAQINAMGNPAIYLSYFGTADPSAYGFHYAPVGFVSNVERKGDAADPSASGRVLLAVSATNLQCTYFADKSLFDWLKNRTPLRVVDYSIFLYDLTGDAQAYQSLARLLMLSGQSEAAKALAVNSQDPSFPRKRESSNILDPRFRGGDMSSYTSH